MTSPPTSTYLLTAEVGHPIPSLVQRIIEQHDVRVVGDFGGGANPLLGLDEIERLGLRYVVVDASTAELAKTPPGYKTRRLDLTGSASELSDERFDLVVSRYVAEHVADPAAFHSVVRAALRPGGLAAHFFPTLPSAPFVVNRLLNAGMSRLLVDVLQPGRRDPAGRIAKFPAYYRWCEGPTPRQHRRFGSVGFEVVEYVVFVGHRYYERIPALQRAADRLSCGVVARPRPRFSTYAFVVLRRPAES